MTQDINKLLEKLESLDFENLYHDDFFHTWDKSQDELEAIFTVADTLRAMREKNISPKIFDSGLAISLFRDNSTRTRFSYASAANMLGLEVQERRDHILLVHIQQSLSYICSLCLYTYHLLFQLYQP